MNKSNRGIFSSPFFIKLFHWEYWPTYIVHAPTVLMWLWFALKSRERFFFTRVNPVIETGGLLGESKWNIFSRLPIHTIPKTIFFQVGKHDRHFLQDALRKQLMEYPLIAKPDIGERGLRVEKIETEEALLAYTANSRVDFLVQDFISYPLEISVLYYRLPDALNGQITSICIKDTLKVVGDGHSTIEELMNAYPRAKLQLPRFKVKHPTLLQQVLPKNVIKELEPIGNHSRGTTFLNGNHHIDKEITRVFDKINLQMKDIYYGRFDMKCASMETLRKGKDFKILEFNGIGSEPAHIYHPGYSLLKAYKELWQHWKIIYQISEIQKQKGVTAMNLKEWKTHYRSYKEHLKIASV